jgi:hypothetical protein
MPAAANAGASLRSTLMVKSLCQSFGEIQIDPAAAFADGRDRTLDHLIGMCKASRAFHV